MMRTRSRSERDRLGAGPGQVQWMTNSAGHSSRGMDKAHEYHHTDGMRLLEGVEV